MVGTALAVFSRRLVPDDAAARMLSTAAAIALTSICLALWFVFFSGFSGRLRRAAAAAIVATLVMLAATFRISDMSGGFVPHLVWRAHRPPDGAVPAPLHPVARWLADRAADVFVLMAPLALAAWLLAFLGRKSALRWLPAAMLLALAVAGNIAAARAWHRPAEILARLGHKPPHTAQVPAGSKAVPHQLENKRQLPGSQPGQETAHEAGDAHTASVQSNDVQIESAQAPNGQHGPLQPASARPNNPQPGGVQTGSVQASGVQAGGVQAGSVQPGSVQPRNVRSPASGKRASAHAAHQDGTQPGANAQRVDVTPVPHGPHDFPQFLGPDRNGSLSGRGLARDWTAHPPRLVWKLPIGPGWSGFAVVGDYAVTQQQLEELELVVCYSLKSGEVLWSHGNRVRFSSVIAGDGPRATPTIAEGRVFALGSTGILNALALADGSPLWDTDILVDHAAKPLPWGQSGSPLVVDGLVVVNPGGPQGHSLAAYDAVSGELRWHAGNDAASYASPTLVTLAGKQQIVMVNQFSVTGHDPATGTLLWTYPPPGLKDHTWLSQDPKVPQPLAVSPNRLLIAAGYGLGSMLLELEPRSGGDWQVRELWDGFNRHLKPKFTNLVLHEGHVYGLDDGTALTCLEIATGERRWKQGRYGHGQVLLVDDLLLVQSDTGRVALVEASPRGYRELASFQAIEGKTWNTPTLAGRMLLVRNDREAACYELPTVAASARHNR